MAVTVRFAVVCFVDRGDGDPVRQRPEYVGSGRDAVRMARRMTEASQVLRLGLADLPSNQPHHDDQDDEDDQHQRHPRPRHTAHRVSTS